MNNLKAGAFASSLFVSLFVISGQVFAATQSCKGMAGDACEKSTSCTWVKAFSRKNGKTVAAYCRTKRTSKQDMALLKTTKE